MTSDDCYYILYQTNQNIFLHTLCVVCELAAAGVPKPKQADVPQIAEPVPVTWRAPGTWTISTLEISTLKISIELLED